MNWHNPSNHDENNISHIAHKHSVLRQTPPEVKRLASYIRYLVYRSEDIRRVLCMDQVPQRKHYKIPLTRMKKKRPEEGNNNQRHIQKALENMSRSNTGNGDNKHDYHISYAIIKPQQQAEILNEYIHTIGEQLIHIVAWYATLQSGKRIIRLKSWETIIIPPNTRYSLNQYRDTTNRTSKDLELLLIYHWPHGQENKII